MGAARQADASRTHKAELPQNRWGADNLAYGRAFQRLQAPAGKPAAATVGCPNKRATHCHHSFTGRGRHDLLYRASPLGVPGCAERVTVALFREAFRAPALRGTDFQFDQAGMVARAAQDARAR